MDNPLVSICIPTHNGVTYLAEALQSAINQTYPHLEIVVSDDASTDATLEIVETFKQKTQIPIRVFHHTPSGIGANWNHCMQQAKGEYIKFLFQDDLLEPNCIELMVNVLENNPNVGMVGCKRKFIVDNGLQTLDIEKWIQLYANLQCQYYPDDNENVTLNKKNFSDKFLMTLPLNKIGEPTATMFRISIQKKIGLFHEEMKQSLDIEYWYRIMKISDILILGDSLVSFRLHHNQATQANMRSKENDMHLLEKALYKDYFWLVSKQRRIKLFKKFHPVSDVYRFFKKIFK